MITRVPDEIEDRLEAHKADLNALEISSQAATTFVVQTRQGHTPPTPRSLNTHSNTDNTFPNTNNNCTVPKPVFQCNNC